MIVNLTKDNEMNIGILLDGYIARYIQMKLAL